MAEFGSPRDRIQATPLTHAGTTGGAVDPLGLSTVPEVPRSSPDSYGKTSYRRPSNSQSFNASRDASLESSLAHSYHEKALEEPPRRLRHTGPAQASPRTWQRSEGPAVSLQNGHGVHKEKTFPNATSTRKDKRSGFRNTIRRIFSRRSARDRISMPATAPYRRYNPEEFITSATDVKAPRVESTPPQGFLRTSGLGSHPPDQETFKPFPQTDVPVPSQPERSPPERPARPRRASVPSPALSRQEMNAIDAMSTEPDVQISQDQPVDVQNIGFAVTNGSNPKRRSRSVGAFRDSEHRMSPIQWRRWRRRSDEIKYWRASSDLNSVGVKGLDSPEMAQNIDDNTATEDGDHPVETHASDFNFGLPRNEVQNQESVGLEERLVTLEIKLMDFEYALSKLQASSGSPSRRHSRQIGRQDSADSYQSSDGPHAPSESASSLPSETPPMTSSQWAKDITPKTRPTSVATTLKPGHSAQAGSVRKKSIDRSTRSSLMGLTIDHYTTLITLIRTEQSSRQRLEQQVSLLQGRLDAMSTPPPQLYQQSLSQSQRSYSRSLSPSQRRQGFVDLRGGAPSRQPRRSSSYSTTETDTDDDAFHDVYVTPDITPVERERGEYERGAFERVAGMEEGVAF